MATAHSPIRSEPGYILTCVSVTADWHEAVCDSCVVQVVLSLQIRNLRYVVPLSNRGKLFCSGVDSQFDNKLFYGQGDEEKSERRF